VPVRTLTRSVNLPRTYYEQPFAIPLPTFSTADFPSLWNVPLSPGKMFKPRQTAIPSCGLPFQVSASAPKLDPCLRRGEVQSVSSADEFFSLGRSFRDAFPLPHTAQERRHPFCRRNRPWTVFQPDFPATPSLAKTFKKLRFFLVLAFARATVPSALRTTDRSDRSEQQLSSFIFLKHTASFFLSLPPLRAVELSSRRLGASAGLFCDLDLCLPSKSLVVRDRSSAHCETIFFSFSSCRDFFLETVFPSFSLLLRRARRTRPKSYCFPSHSRQRDIER